MKPYRTIDEQVALLRLRGLEVQESDRLLLQRTGYYSLVNGYKIPFLDLQRTSSQHPEHYRSGSSLAHLGALYDFDRSLRLHLMRALFASESTLRESVVRQFCATFGHGEEYLNHQYYSDGTDGVRTPRGPFEYRESRDWLIGRVLTPIARFSGDGSTRRPAFLPAVHHRDKYGYVPMWVTSLKLTFGQVCYLFGHQQLSVQKKVCADLREQYRADWGIDGNVFYPNTVDEYYSFLRELRNVCAHDERCFSHSVAVRRKNRDVSGIAGLVKYFVRRSDYLSMVEGVDSSLSQLENEIPGWAFLQVAKSVSVQKL